MLPIRFTRTTKVAPPSVEDLGGMFDRVFKGDLPGHPFHGNQYTDVAGTHGGVTEEAPRGHKSSAEIAADKIVSGLDRYRDELKPYLGRPSPKTPTVSTVDEALALAKSDVPAFKKALEDFAKNTGGTVRYPPESSGGALKDRSSTEGKINRTGKKPSDLSDLVRATIEYPTLEVVYAGAVAATKTYGQDLEQVDDKIAMPTAMGYRDVSLKVRNPNGSIGEIIISTPEISAVKFGRGHKLYEENRLMEEKMVNHGLRVMSQEDESLHDVNDAISNRLYAEAIVAGTTKHKFRG